MFLARPRGPLCLPHGPGAAARPADLRGARGLPALHKQVPLPHPYLIVQQCGRMGISTSPLNGVRLLQCV